MRVTRSRDLVAEGYRPSAVARVAQISRQAIYRVPRPRRVPPSPSWPPADEIEAAIVVEAEANPTDGYRLVTAWVRRRLGRAVNRKRVLRVMRERRLIQRRRPSGRRRRPGVLPRRAPRPALAPGYDLGVGGRARLGLPDGRDRLLHARDRRLARGGPLPRQGSDRPDRARRHRTRHRARDTDARDRQWLGVHGARVYGVLATLGIVHRRGGYRDPESQAFIESWFGKLKERCVWRHEFETLDQAREAIGTYVIHYHHRPHSRLAYRMPLEVAATWNDEGLPHLTSAA
jgi:putative transposase